MAGACTTACVSMCYCGRFLALSLGALLWIESSSDPTVFFQRPDPSWCKLVCTRRTPLVGPEGHPLRANTAVAAVLADELALKR